MRYPALPAAKRLINAEVAGAVSRLSAGPDSDLDLIDKLDDLWSITRDPQILGHALGPYLAEEFPTVATARAVVLLWVAGADGRVAEMNAAWQRERRIRELGGGPRT